MKLTKAIITAAAPGQRKLPLQMLADDDGDLKPAIRIQINEIFGAGIERIGLVVSAGETAAYQTLLADFGSKIEIMEQPEPLGYGHAVLCARPFVEDQPFLLQVCDHLYISGEEKSCTRQLIETAEHEKCSLSAVEATHESQLSYYGTIGGGLLRESEGLYRIERVLEKPTPTIAEQQCLVPGLRHGFYLCFFGMHILTPRILDILDEHLAGMPGGDRLGLSPALSELQAKESYLASVLNGRRANLERRFGYLRAQLALSLNGECRDEILGYMMEELAQSRKGG
ncbi:MAG: sugar phosphate nucleotidyltransferase [Opitutales bacterium]